MAKADMEILSHANMGCGLYLAGSCQEDCQEDDIHMHGSP